MREETERQFRELLEQHDREFLKSVTPSTERALREQEFDRQFHELARDVIEPIMTKLRALMHDHGLESAIVVAERRIDADSKITPSSIAFEFRVLTDPEIHGFPVTIPTLTFIADPANRNVLVHENSILPFFGGHVGVIEQCVLGELTGEFVEKHLLAIARKVLRGTGAT